MDGRLGTAVWTELVSPDVISRLTSRLESPDLNAPRYYSNVVIDGKKPACMWIDANHDQPITAFQLHFADFVSNDGNFAHDTN